jgi:hypothetical protein
MQQMLQCADSPLVNRYLLVTPQQPENCENRENRNDPDLVQAFLKKWWVESDFMLFLQHITNTVL